jgi:hypothetical protein
MLRSFSAFETALDRMAGGYFVVLALAVAGALVSVVL